MAWYDQYINSVFNPSPQPPISNTQQQNTSGNGNGRGFWNGGFMDRIANGFGNFAQNAARGRQARGGYDLNPFDGYRRNMPMQPQNPFEGMTGQGIASPQTQAAFNGVPNAVPMPGNPNIYVHPETAQPYAARQAAIASGFARRPMRLIGDQKQRMTRSTNGY